MNPRYSLLVRRLDCERLPANFAVLRFEWKHKQNQANPRNYERFISFRRVFPSAGEGGRFHVIFFREFSKSVISPATSHEIAREKRLVRVKRATRCAPIYSVYMPFCAAAQHFLPAFQKLRFVFLHSGKSTFLSLYMAAPLIFYLYRRGIFCPVFFLQFRREFAPAIREGSFWNCETWKGSGGDNWPGESHEQWK